MLVFVADVRHVQRIVFLPVVLHVDDPRAVRHPGRARLDVGHNIRCHDLGGKPVALRRVRSVRRDHDDGPDLRIVRRIVIGVKGDLLSVRRPDRPQIVDTARWSGPSATRRALPASVMTHDIVVLVAAVHHGDLSAVRRPLRVQVGFAAARQPGERPGREVHEVEVAVARSGPKRRRSGPPTGDQCAWPSFSLWSVSRSGGPAQFLRDRGRNCLRRRCS